MKNIKDNEDIKSIILKLVEYIDARFDVLDYEKVTETDSSGYGISAYKERRNVDKVRDELMKLIEVKR